ncbi:MAG: phosphodiester glycosidase family protein [Candidatus Riflebacteria bacterium]|nr:phosphodiester glycosidase family protein [Candidatus Riflebacteria bacterium]
MAPPEPFGQRHYMELLTEKEYLLAESEASDFLLSEFLMEHASSTEDVSSELIETVKTEIAATAAEIKAEKKAVLSSVKFRTEEAHGVMEFFFDKPVQILKRNTGISLLKLRFVPALEELAPEVTAQIEEKFNKVTFYYTDSYTELLLATDHKFGTPYTASKENEPFRLCVPFRLEEKGFPLVHGTRIQNGLVYYRDRTPSGNGMSDIHILKIDPFADNLDLIPSLGQGGISKRETLSSMSKRYKALAGINGAYFAANGSPIGTLIINKKLLSSSLYKRSVFGITEDGILAFGNPDFSGTLKAGSLSIEIDAVNQPLSDNSLVVYTPEYVNNTAADPPELTAVLVKGKIVGIYQNDALIPPDGVAVSATGEKAALLSKLSLGQSVKLDYSIQKPWNNIKHAICGGPRLLADGQISINGQEEKFHYSIVKGRHPRTAVGATFDGDLLFVVVDGRSARSKGMTLQELAAYLQKLGVRHAINLDGGGSTSMVINDKTVNIPSDGRERRISNGILITAR